MSDGKFPTLKFVPNHDDPSGVDEFISDKARRHNQDPEAAIVVPFSALEGAINEVDSSLTADGHPVPVQIVGTKAPTVVEETSTTPLGEELADELETFNPPTPSEIAKQTITYIVGENEDPYHHVIRSEQDIAELEQEATTGEREWGTLLQQASDRCRR